MKTHHTAYINGTHGNVTHLTNTTSVTTETKVCSTDVPEGLCRFFDDFKSLVQGLSTFYVTLCASIKKTLKRLPGYFSVLCLFT